jgi:aryl-alcohol dehydrogenase-like predicted oxidoreductase
VQYRDLGRTGLRVSAVGVGTWQFGGEWGQDFGQAEVDAILERARELGCNLIDTAECYGDHLSERRIGDYLRRRGRDGWIVATKFGHKFHGFMDRSWDSTVPAVRTQLEDSLRALGTDAIDLYQFHSGSDDAFREDALWTFLAEQKRAGRIRHLGLSIRGAGSALQVLRAAAVGAESLQVVYNRLDRRPEADVFPVARREGLGILARVPLASGFLSGRHAPGAAFPAGDVRSTFDAAATAARLDEARRILASEVPAGMPAAQWALAWCLRETAVSAVIPGCRSVAQVESNAKAADIVLPAGAA